MKKYFILINLFLIFIIDSYGAAMPVTDPGSYSYMVKLVEHGNKYLEDMTKLIDFSNLTKKGVDEVAGGLIGYYNKTVDLTDALQRMKRNVNNLPFALDQAIELDLEENERSFSPFVNMEKYLVNRYGDSSIQGTLMRERAKDKMREELAKQADNNLLGAKDDFKTLYSLSNRIGKTKTAKESMDLQNELLASIAASQQRLLTMQSSLVQLKNIEEYKAINVKSKKILNEYNRYIERQNKKFSGKNEFSKEEKISGWMERQAAENCAKIKIKKPKHVCSKDKRKNWGI